jgi:hypothetical protein
VKIVPFSSDPVIVVVNEFAPFKANLKILALPVAMPVFSISPVVLSKVTEAAVNSAGSPKYTF